MSAPRRGVALLLVLWLVVVLGAIGSSVVVVVRERLHITTNLRDRASARAAAESGIVALVQAVEDSLGRMSAARRDRYLNALEDEGHEAASVGDAHFSVTAVDVNARLDINMADENALARFFAGFTGAVRAREIAHAVRERTGSSVPGVVSRPLLDADALGAVAGMDARVRDAVMPFITVDGDGNVNLQRAAPSVRRVAAGQVVSAPTRLMFVSRGTRSGSSLVHEIQVVYAVQGSQLAMVRWRERDL